MYASRMIRPVWLAACGAAWTVVPTTAVGADDADVAAALARVRAVERVRVECIQRVVPSVVCIFPRGSRAGGGSGVIIDPQGYGLTNFHVVRPFAGSRLGEGGLPDGRRYPLHVLGLDPTGDVAMFRLEADQPFIYAPLGESSRLRVGDWTLAMGNPFLLAEDYQPTVTSGIVSGLHRYQKGTGRALVYTDCIQVDTSINPGNSGGPLFDLRGELVGINGRISVEERGRVNVGLGYAISIDQIRRFLPALRAGLTVRHGTLNCTVRERRGVAGEVLVDQILADGAAQRAGLRLGDRIVRYNGTPILSGNQLLNLVGAYPGGWPVTVVYERDGRQTEVRLRLDDVPLPEQAAAAEAAPARRARRNPFRPNAAANRRAARRALERYRRSVGRADALTEVVAVRYVGQRRSLLQPDAPAQPLDLADERPAAETATQDASDAAQRERMIRWQLLAEGGERAFKVVGGDEVAGRVAVVLEDAPEGAPACRVAFDDAAGTLLQLELDAAGPGGEPVRFEYDDWRRAGLLRMPYRRRMYAGDRLVFEDEFRNIRPRTRGLP